MDFGHHLRDLQAQITLIHQQQQLQLELQAAREEGKGEAVPDPEFKNLVPGHFQWKRIKDDERKRLLRHYPKIKGVEPITDANGLASRTMPAEKKRYVTKDLVQVQRENIDILRVASKYWKDMDSIDDFETLFQQTRKILRVVTALAVDNASRAAEQQLGACLEHADAKGAKNLIVQDELDISDKNVFQQVHVDAIKTYKDFNRQVDAAVKNSDTKKTGNRFKDSQRNT